MRKFIFLLWLICGTVFGQSIPDYEIKAIGRVHGWHDEPVGKPSENNLRAGLRVDGWVDVTPSGLPKGCLRVASRLASGDRYNSEWALTGVGDGEADLNLNLRQLYVSSTCLKNVTVDVGAVPVRRHGVLGLSDSGYIDGVSVVIDDEDHGRNIIVSVGAIDGEPNLFKRDYDHVNHAGIQIKQSISKELSGFVSLAKYNDSLFSRGGLVWALSQYSKWLKETGAEVLFSEDRLIGGMISTKFDLKKFETSVFVARINPTVDGPDKLGLVMKQFYGYGTNFYVEANRRLSPNMVWNVRLRFGDAGPRIQTGITVQLGKKRH